MLSLNILLIYIEEFREV